MTLAQIQAKSSPPLALPAPADLLTFDLEGYKAVMAREIDPNVEANRIFYEALDFAYDLHEGQTRKSGAPYISHPCAVAQILATELHFRDPLLLSAALLHDVVEDIPSMTIGILESRFGSIVAELVDGCTKLTRSHLDRATLRDLTHSKIFVSASRRLGVLIIKLADRLHNLRTLHFLGLSKRQRISQETVEVYAPIASRLNMFHLKRELYHLALTHLYPRKTRKILQFARDLRESPVVLQVESRLNAALAGASMVATVRPRAKGLGSYYNPLKRTLDLSTPENYIDFVIVLETTDVIDCYTAMGIVSTHFSPIPRTIRDFVANPKSNGYQSLHMRIHREGQNFLIKLRTAEMDRWAAYGILSDWDAQKSLSDESWHEVSELLRSIGEYGGAAPQRKALIRLSEGDEIFAYSPRGDIYYLPRGSVILDFAYKIHSDLGDFCEGAYVNGDWVSPSHPIKDGDTIEVVTGSSPLEADLDLEIRCKTPRARIAINRKLQQKRFNSAKETGRQILQQELRRNNLPPDVLEEDQMHFVLEILNVKDLGDLYARVGQDLLSPRVITYYLAPSRVQEPEKNPPRFPKTHNKFERYLVEVRELDRAVHKFARCCSPHPGQAEVVLTLSERGITFHKNDCRDLYDRHGLQPQELFDVAWGSGSPWKRPHIFCVLIAQETVRSVLTRLTDLPEGIHILSTGVHHNRRDEPMVRVKVRLRDYDDARAFFESIPADRSAIEDFWWESDVKRLREARNDPQAVAPE